MKHVLFLPGYYVRANHRGLASYARAAGWRLDGGMVRTGTVPTDWRGDGIITYSAGRADIADAIDALKLPTVDLFNGRKTAGVPRVLLHNQEIGRMAGEYLVSLGFRDVAYCFWNPTRVHDVNEQERAAGLCAAVQDAGRKFHEIDHCERLTRIRSLPKPAALMVQNDVVGSLLIDELTQSGFRIPQEIAVIAVSNDELAQFTSSISQTCVVSNLQYQGERAARLLDRMMDGEPPPCDDCMISPLHVMERASTSLVASSNEPTNKALELMSRRFDEPLTVEVIARHAGVSRHHLARQFQAHLGESVGRRLKRLRLRHAMRALVQGDQKIESVAVDAGFRSAAYFSTVFLRETGVSPAKFRTLARECVFPERVGRDAGGGPPD